MIIVCSQSLSLPGGSLYEELITKTRGMPEDVKSMLGRGSSTTQSRRETLKSLKTRHLSRETVSTPKRLTRGTRDSSAPPPSVKRKFEEHDKRKVISEFLRSPKKSSVNLENVPLRLQTTRERKLTVVNAMRSPAKNLPPVSPAPAPSLDLPAKPDMADIIIAAAAAKMVKLDPTGWNFRARLD